MTEINSAVECIRKYCTCICIKLWWRVYTAIINHTNYWWSHFLFFKGKFIPLYRAMGDFFSLSHAWNNVIRYLPFHLILDSLCKCVCIEFFHLIFSISISIYMVIFWTPHIVSSQTLFVRLILKWGNYSYKIIYIYIHEHL